MKKLQDIEDCAGCTEGVKTVALDKVMAVTGLVAGLLIVAFAVDLLTGGRLADGVDGLFGGEGAVDDE